MKTTKEIIEKIQNVRYNGHEYVCEVNGEIVIHEQPSLLTEWKNDEPKKAMILGMVSDFIEIPSTSSDNYTNEMINS